MAQNLLKLTNAKGHEVIIHSADDDTKKPAALLKKYLDQAFDNPFQIQNSNANNTKIVLEINSDKKIDSDSFIIKSDEKNIYLIGIMRKRYAMRFILY